MKDKKKRIFLKTAGLALLCAVLGACKANPAPAPKPADELDAAVREASDYLNKQLPKGNKLVILNVQSDFPALSEYIIDELTANTVNDRVFSVVDRQQLDAIRAELDFQMSGEVDDTTAQELGRMAGAQVIISGAVSRIGDLYRLRVRALSVENAQISGQFNRNIPDGPTVSVLARSQATGYGGGSSGMARNTKPATASGGSATSASSAAGGPAASASTVPGTVPASPATAAPASTASTGKPQPAPAPAPAKPAPASPQPTATPTPAPAVVYKIGDKGPAGGWIFYDKGNNSGGWRYLEAAPKDSGTAQWGAYDYDVGKTGIEIGTGKENTRLIALYLRRTGETERAAQLCDELVVNGFDDWFLPSKDELNLMYRNLWEKAALGGFTNNSWYWSSSQSNNAYAWMQKFSDGDRTDYNKTNTRSVRAVRAF